MEYHDIFRSILLTLFESIRKPQSVSQHFLSNQCLAFSDFLAHIAFIRTVPAPSFNTHYRIEFMDKTLLIDEGRFDELPNKSHIAIKVLFDILDVRSIIYCWKALLFDHSLVLISQ